MVSSLGLTSSYAALILPFITTPLGVFLMRQFMLGIPDELIEAARIDGAGSCASSPVSSCRCAGRRWRPSAS